MEKKTNRKVYEGGLEILNNVLKIKPLFQEGCQDARFVSSGGNLYKMTIDNKSYFGETIQPQKSRECSRSRENMIKLHHKNKDIPYEVHCIQLESEKLGICTSAAAERTLLQFIFNQGMENEFLNTNFNIAPYGKKGSIIQKLMRNKCGLTEPQMHAMGYVSFGHFSNKNIEMQLTYEYPPKRGNASHFLVCPVQECGLCYYSIDYIKPHLRKEHKNMSEEEVHDALKSLYFKCKKCRTTSARRQEMQSHLRRQHDLID